jgi:multidrug efflux pump subunit AcrB
MAEIRTPLLMSTVTIVLAFIPLGFITGMMGPYMAPMAFNVPVSITASALVAFLVTPWLASRMLRVEVRAAASDQAGALKPRCCAVYSRMLQPLLQTAAAPGSCVGGVLLLFVLTASLPLFRLVPLKLLPYDNKNEIQVVIDMPEYSSLEAPRRVAREVSNLASHCSCRRCRPSPPSSARRRRSTSTAWCAAITSAAGRTWPICG